MSHRRQFAKIIAAAFLSTLCGCTDQPVFEKLFSTDHFDYYIEPGAEPPCDGTGEWLERYYKANAKFFGAELPAGDKIEYHLVGSDESMAAVGCADVGGCAPPGRIYSLLPLHSHEIVHANAYSIGNPPLLFQEGLATMLGCTQTDDSLEQADISAPIEDLIDSDAFEAWRIEHGFGAYDAAASFVRHVIHTFGLPNFLAFYAQASHDGSSDDVKRVFKREFGLSIDDAFSSWRKLPAPLPGDLCLRLMECDTMMPLLGDGDAKLECGPTGGFGAMREAVFKFQIEDDQSMHITTAPSQSAPIELSFVDFYRCESGNVSANNEYTFGFILDNKHDLIVDPHRSSLHHVLDAPPGDYVAWFMSPAETQIHVEVEDSGSPMREGCTPGVSPLPLMNNQELVLTTRWSDHACSGFWCPGHSWDVVIGSEGAIGWDPLFNNGAMAPFIPEKLYLCSDPCPTDPNACETLTLDANTGKPAQSKQTFAPGTIVHIGAPLAPLKEHFSVRMRLVPPCNGNVPCTDPWHGPR
jgi:hypothetical protein